MTFDRIGMGLKGILASGVVAVAASMAFAAVLRSHVQRGGPPLEASIGAPAPIAVDFLSEVPAKQKMFNKGLPMRVDTYTVLQRVDHNRGHWTFHFLVSYYITKVKEFQEKKHATTISALCMDESFVRSLKDSGPFLYQYLDPSGQTADVVIPKDDCGD